MDWGPARGTLYIQYRSVIGVEPGSDVTKSVPPARGAPGQPWLWTPVPVRLVVRILQFTCRMQKKQLLVGLTLYWSRRHWVLWRRSPSDSWAPRHGDWHGKPTQTHPRKCAPPERGAQTGTAKRKDFLVRHFQFVQIRANCPRPFRRKKRETMELSPLCPSLVRPSVRPLVQPKLYGRHSSVTTGPIDSKSSSLELSWPVDVQRHLPIGSQGRTHGCNKSSRKRADSGTPQPPGDSLQIKFNGTVLACRWSFAHRAHMGVLMGVIRVSGILRTPKLSNHQADSFQIKFIGLGL